MRVDTLELDDRREIWRLLEKLTPGGRVRFLQKCCRGACDGPLGGVQVTGHSGTVGEAYRDLMMLEVVYQQPINDLACRLERFVRKGG